MANFNNKLDVHEGATVTNWISQINAGGTVYDIATHHSIKFVEGGEETTWNGLSDLTVVIPTIQDIVQTPIEFAGTVGADGKITWVNGHSEPAEIGNLVFITADCKFQEKACEAGDMAIFDGKNWNIVSGENQVQLVGTTDENNKLTVAVGSAKDVLTVEGKTLALTLDYAELDTHVSVSKTNGSAVSVEFGDITVDAVNLKLNQADAETKTIGKDTTFKNATALKDGTVNLSNADSLVKSVDFGKFEQGTLPEIKRNTEKTFAVSGGSLTAGAGTDFVANVTFGDVTFVDAGEGDSNKISMLTGISAKDGNEFLNGIHLTGTDETADLTIEGAYAPTKGATTTFVEGLKEGSKVLTSFTAGSFTLTSGDALVTGFAEGSDEVIDTVTASVNTKASVFSSASVSDHVLSFGTTEVATGVSVSTSTKKLSLTKTGFSYVPSSVTDSEFVTSGFTKAANVDYTFGKAAETTYTADSKMWKLQTPTLDVTKGAYTINNSGMVATVGADVFVESVTQGTLPTWTGMSAPTVKVTGSVGTELSVSDVTVKELTSDTIALPGAYTLVSVATGGDVTVGAAGASVDIAESTVNLTGYLTDVDVTIA